MAMNNPFIHFCYPCSRQQKYQIAAYYCTNCGQTGAYICWQCKRYHEKFEEMHTHRIHTLATGNCSTGQYGCSCAGLNFNSAESGPHTSERIQKNVLEKENFCVIREVQNLIDNFEIATAHLSTVEAKRQASIEKLTEDKNRIEDTIKDIRVNLNKILDRLERETMRELEIRYRRMEDKIKSEIENVRDVSDNLEENMKDLMATRGRTDFEAFQKIVENGNILKRRSEKLWEHSRLNVESEKLDFAPCQDIVNGKFDLKSFGNFVDDKIHEFNTSLQDEYDISIATDDPDIECDITGCCVMSDGTVILADHSNANLKKLNITYKVVAACNLPEPPCDLCSVDNNEVAVTLPRKKTVQFVSVVDKLRMTKSLYVGHGCMSIDYSTDLQRLYVTYDWPMQIRVFNRDGDFLLAIWGTDKEGSTQVDKQRKGKTERVTDLTKTKTRSSKRKFFCVPHKREKSETERQQIFTSLEDIMFRSTDRRLYACDMEKGLIILTDDAQLVSTIRNFREMPEFAPKRISRGCRDDFFIFGQSEKTKEFGILHVGKDNKVEKIKGNIKKMRDIHDIESMCFNRFTNQLIISTKADNYIKIFNVI